jgi:hypothetical protein
MLPAILMYYDSEFFEPCSVNPPIQAFLDGMPVPLPPAASSLASVRFHLETLALERNRILCALKVDGNQVNLAKGLLNHGSFACVEAEAIDVGRMPLQFLQTALEQTEQTRALVLEAVSRVLINDGPNGRMLWWSLAAELKNPLVTLRLVTDAACQPAHTSASVLQLRKWQLQQLAAIMKEVEEISASQDVVALSTALEQRVLPWLSGLERSLALLPETLWPSQPSVGYIG